MDDVAFFIDAGLIPVGGPIPGSAAAGHGLTRLTGDLAPLLFPLAPSQQVVCWQHIRIEDEFNPVILPTRPNPHHVLPQA